MKHSEKITLVTGNPHKAKAFERLLGFEIDCEKIDLPEIQTVDVREVSAAKAAAAYDSLQRPVFVDDSGLSIDAWHGLPGALVKWFLETVGNEGIIRMLANEENRSARVITSIGYKDATQEFVVTGEVLGRIADGPRGDNGFGYAALFIPEGSNKTFAEMSDDEQDAVSMRALAARAFYDRLMKAQQLRS